MAPLVNPFDFDIDEIYLECTASSHFRAGELLPLRQCSAIYRTTLSDVLIVCGGVRLYTHSRILSTHSPVLRRLCRSGTGGRWRFEINLDEEPLIAVKATVDYLYTLQYRLPRRAYRCLHHDSGGPESSAAIPPLVHAQVFTAATNYCMPHLGALAIAHFAFDLRIDASHLIVAESPGHAKANIAWTDFRTVAQYVYDNTPPHIGQLRHWLMRCILADVYNKPYSFHRTNRGDLSVWTGDQFDEILTSVPAFAADLYTAVSGLVDHNNTAITLQDICTAMLCGPATVDELRAIGDPPPDLYLEDDAEDWRSEAVDEEVAAELEDPEYDVRASVQEDSDPPSDLHLSDYIVDNEMDAVDSEMEDIAAEVMDMVYASEYDVRAEARGSGDPPRDLYLMGSMEHAMDCKMEEVAGEVMDMIHGHAENEQAERSSGEKNE